MPTTTPGPRVGPQVERQVERQVEPRIEPRPVTTDDGDHDRFAHYVPESQLQLSRRYGTPVRALCGKRWVPDADPSRYPMCPTCAEIVAEALGRGLLGE